MITGNGLPWWLDRQKRINWYLNRLMIGDSIVSEDSHWRIVFLFLNSKIPQYIVYRDDKKVFPLDRQATTKRKDLLEYLLNQDPSNPDQYLDHKSMIFIENGCIDQMTDISDMPTLEIIPAISFNVVAEIS